MQIRILALLVMVALTAGCGLKAKTYVMTKERVDIEQSSPDATYKTGNAGYIMGAPKFIEPQRKTRKVYILELTKPLAEGEVKKIEQETTVTHSTSQENNFADTDSQGVSQNESSNKIVIPAIKDDDVEPVENKVLDNEAVVQTGPAEDTSYTVMKDDTLQKISKKFYGSYGGWIKIYNANKDKIKNPNLLKSGTVITIPAAN